MQPFRVALCQLEAHGVEDAEANFQGALAALDEAGAQGGALVCLPECTYPAYFLRDTRPYAREGVRPHAEVVAAFGERARRHGYWLAAGVAVPHTDGSLTNSGLVFAPDGTVAGRYDKAFPWHFDRRWFRQGTSFPVFDAGFARLGVLICADGRQPEVARALALGGAEVIVDLTAWVSSGPEMARLSNPQCEYMMPVRAYENGCWVVAADKWGIEAGSIIYAGRSLVIDPAGQQRFCAPSDRGGVFLFDLEPMAAPVLPPRRPPLYGLLGEPTAGLPVTHRLAEPAPVHEARVAVVPGRDRFDAPAMLRQLETLRLQDADIVLFGGCWAPEGWQVELATLEAGVRELGGAIAVGVRSEGCAAQHEMVYVGSEGTFVHRASHGRGIQAGDALGPCFETKAGRTALLCGDELELPEVARVHTLAGAELLLWAGFAPHGPVELLLRCRADENRVFAAGAWAGGAALVNPNGSVAALSPAGSGASVAAPVNPALARLKEMAPGTHVIEGRAPGAYRALLR